MLDTKVETAVIVEAVRSACRAPSLHNSQPWRWVAEGGRLDLFLDLTRTVHGDRSSREALISCGAALDHLRVATAAAGWSTEIVRFPDPADPQHLATVGFAPAKSVTEPAAARAAAILTRRTDRLPFLPPTNWQPVAAGLSGGMDGGVRLDVLDDGLRPKLAEVAEYAEALRLYDSSYHAELNWWTAPFEVSDGIPQSALVSAAESDRVDVGRVFPVTRHRERRSGIGDDRAKILVLSTADDSPAAALACGEALSRTLLDCTAAGLATCPLTHLTEIPTSRAMLAALTGHRDLPQILVRVGSVPEPSGPGLEDVPTPTPRRSLTDVLEVRA